MLRWLTHHPSDMAAVRKTLKALVLPKDLT